MKNKAAKKAIITANFFILNLFISFVCDKVNNFIIYCNLLNKIIIIGVLYALKHAVLMEMTVWIFPSFVFSTFPT